MRNLLIVFTVFSLMISSGCTMPELKNEKMVDQPLPERKDAFHQLCQYWELTDAERPTYRDLDERKDDIFNIPGIVFMTDSTFLENPKAEMRYGKFTFKGKEIDAQFDDGKKAVYTVQEKQGNTMTMKRSEKGQSTILYLKGAEVFWPDASKNPFNKMNSAWRVKPTKAESEDELKARLKGCVQFYQYFFKGYVDSKSDEIDYTGLPSCFKWYEGGIFVQGEKKLDKKWIDCFYSEQQALQARQTMEDVLSKKYDWDTTERNWIKQLVPVLKQVHDKL
ncbi:MAG: hypothetical protein ABI594_19615 [Ginsengibacter sp.]